MESYLTTETKATPVLLSASKEFLMPAEQPSTLINNVTRARCMFLKGRLLELRQMHQDACNGKTELSIGEFVNMQKEMYNINYELKNAA